MAEENSQGNTAKNNAEASQQSQQFNDVQMQGSYQRMQLLQQLLESIGQNVESMEENKSEVSALKDSISGLDSGESNKEDLVMLANGIFLKARIESFDNFVVGVGRNIMVEKNKEQLLQFLDSKVGEMDESLNELRSQYQEIANEFTSIYKQLTGQDSEENKGAEE